MARSIKVERLSAKYINGRIVTDATVDITQETVMPIVDNARVDEVLDSTELELRNHDGNPLPQDTRIVITYTDSSGSSSGTETLYRIVESDTVERISWGTNPMYKHTVSLLEITKLLERVKLPNLTFTNYMDADALTGGASFATVSATIKYLDGEDMTVNTATIQPRYLGVENFELEVGGAASGRDMFNSGCIYFSHSMQANEMGITGTDLYTRIETLQATSAVLSDGLHDPLEITEHTSNLAGMYPVGWMSGDGLTKGPLVLTSKYQFNPRIAGTGEIATDYTYTVITTRTWYVGADGPFVRAHTYREVLRGILRKAQTLRENTDLPAQMYVLDSRLDDRQDKVLDQTAPEYMLTDKTLFDALLDVSGSINAIPRLIPNPDDETNWSTVTLDFLEPQTHAGRRIPNDSLRAVGNRYDAHASKYVSDVRNATVGSNSDLSLTEPFIDQGWLTPRADSPGSEINNDTAILETSYPIQRVRSLILRDVSTPLTADGTYKEAECAQYVLENGRYKTLSEYATGTTAGGSKAFALTFNRAEQGVRGLTFVPKAFIEGLQNRAMTNVMRAAGISDASDNLKGHHYRISYDPLIDVRIHHYKPYFAKGEANLPNELTYNQASNAVDITAFGQNIRNSAMRLDNDVTQHTCYTDDLAREPRVMERTDDGIVFNVCREIGNHTNKITYETTREYNKLNSLVSLRSNPREWEISESDTVRRSVSLDEFLILSFDKTDTWEECAFGNERYMTRIADRFATFASSNVHQQISYFLGWTYDIYGTKRKFLRPVCAFSAGNSLYYTVTLDDNYSAGSSTSEHKTSLGTNVKSMDYTPYVDRFGKADTLHGFLGTNQPFTETFEAQTLYAFPDTWGVNYADAQVGLDWSDEVADQHPILLDKDSREEVSVTFALHACSDNRRIQVGPSFARQLNRYGANGNVRCVVFKTEPSLYGGVVPKESYSDVSSNFVPTLDDSKLNILMFRNGEGVTYRPEGGINSIPAPGYGLIDDEGHLLLYVENDGSTRSKAVYARVRASYA